MDKFINILSRSEFWIAIAFAFIVSFILATIVQDVVDTLVDNDYSELCYSFTFEEPYVGCMVYDESHNIVGIYCGTHDNNTCGVVIDIVDNKIFYYYPKLETLYTITQA